jgi:hypothetical protein
MIYNVLFYIKKKIRKKYIWACRPWRELSNALKNVPWSQREPKSLKGGPHMATLLAQSLLYHLAISNSATWALFPETKVAHTKVWRIRKYREPKSSRALEVTLGSSTDTNSGHNHTKFKKTYGKSLGFSNNIFSGSSWPLINFIIVFSISVTRATQNSRQN